MTSKDYTFEYMLGKLVKVEYNMGAHKFESSGVLLSCSKVQYDKLNSFHMKIQLHTKHGVHWESIPCQYAVNIKLTEEQLIKDKIKSIEESEL